jgi:UDP-4-amino-4,6-dideoxy-N-acetyl-beta-L-altrosamine N-acetyltransferase
MKGLKSDLKFGNIVLKNFVNLTLSEKMLVLKWRNSQSVRKWCYSRHIISKEEHLQFIKNLKKDNKNFYWLVECDFNLSDKQYIGVISLNKVDFINKHAYLGIYSNPQLKGIGKILMEALKKIAFDIMKLHTLKLEVLETNKHAIEFYKKHGFKKEGKLKEFVYKDRKWIDVIVMGIIKNEKS